MSSPARPARRALPPGESALRRYGALACAFAAASAAIYWPALPGAFISDDIMYVGLNPYVQTASLANVREILDPFGDMALMSANWAPVHLLAHMLEWQLFGVNVAAYHLTNALLHALNSLLLVALLTASGLPWLAAAFAGAFFLVHPANVEAVAWITQLKTLLATAFLFFALLLCERRPALSTAAFVLGLLTKALAAVALPVAWALRRAHGAGDAGRGPGVARRRALPLWPWAAALAGFAVVELAAFFYQHPAATGPPASLASRLAFSSAIGMRYLVMAATGSGVSTFHEVAPPASLLDPWALAGLGAGALLGVRLVGSVVCRRAEAAWWLLAAGSFAPVSQVFPFMYPMADRYLYFVLPGLLGGTLLAARELLAGWSPSAQRAAGHAAAAVAAALCLHFAVSSHARAAIWVSDARVMADAVRHYPDGSMAHYVRARAAAREGDGPRAAAELRLAARHPAFGFQHVRSDPQLNRVRRTAAFQALLRELAQRHIEQSRDTERMTEADLVSLAQAQLVVADAQGALATLERALALRGAFQGVALALRKEAQALERAQEPVAGVPASEGDAPAAKPSAAGAP